jgi:MFS family permease
MIVGGVNYSAVLPTILDDLGISSTAGGAMFSAFFVGYVLLVIPIGMLADTFSNRRILGVSAVGAGVFGMSFGAFTESVLVGVSLRLAAGACFAGVYVPGLSLLTDAYDRDKRGRAFGVYIGMLSLCGGAAYPASSWLSSIGGWRFAIVVTSIPALVAGVVLLWRLDDRGTPSTGEEFIDTSIFKKRSYWYAVTAYSGHNWELFGVQNWIVVYLLTTDGIFASDSPTVLAGILGGAVAGFGLPGNLLGGWISDHIGRVPTSGAALLLSGTATILFVLLSWPSLPILICWVVLYGIVLSADSAPLSAVITEISDDGTTGKALAGQSLIGFSPAIVSPFVFGAALDYSGFTLGFVLMSFGAFAGFLATVQLHRREQFDSTIGERSERASTGRTD